MYSIFIWLMTILNYGFPVYAIWEYFQTRKNLRQMDSEDMVPGFNRAFIAWGLKIFILYWLLFLILAWIQTIHAYVYTSMGEERGGIQHYWAFIQHEKIVGDVVELKAGQESENVSAVMHLDTGMILVPDSRIYWISLIFYNFNALLMITLLILLYSIFKTIAFKKPFLLVNVWKIRATGIILLASFLFEWMYKYISKNIVKQYYHFPLTDFVTTSSDYITIVMLCLSIFIIAEMVRSAAQIKEEQDLTV